MAVVTTGAGFTNRLQARQQPGHIQRGLMIEEAPGDRPAPMFTAGGYPLSRVAITATVAVNLLLCTLGSQPTTVQAALATHSYGANAPQVKAQVAAPVATHTYTAQAPQAQARVQPGAATHTYSPIAPTLGESVAPFAQRHWPNPRPRAQFGAPLAFSQPVQAQGTTVTAPAAAHSYTAQAPQVRARVQPGAATHTYTGQVPVVSAGNTVSVPVATHVYSGQVPSLVTGVPPFKQLAWPLPKRRVWTPVPRSWRPDLAPDTMFGEPGQVKTYVLPNPVRRAPRVHLQRVPSRPAAAMPVGPTVAATVATHSYTMQAPQVRARVQPGAATHTYTGQVPTITAGQAVLAAVATHSYTAQAPKVNAQVKPDAAAHSYAAVAPQLKAQVRGVLATHSYMMAVPQAKASVKPAQVTHSYTALAPQAKVRVQPGAATHTYLARVPVTLTGAGVFATVATHGYAAVAPKVQSQVRATVATHVYSARVPLYVAQIAFTSEPLRARIGATPAVDAHTRIGTSPVDEHERIGPEVGTPGAKRIGDPAK